MLHGTDPGEQRVQVQTVGLKCWNEKGVLLDFELCFRAVHYFFMGALNGVPPVSVKPPHLPAPEGSALRSTRGSWAEISISAASHANRIVIWEYNKALGAEVNK